MIKGKVRHYDREMYGGGSCHRIELWFGSDRYVYADVFSGELRVGGEPYALYVTFGYEVCGEHGGNFIPEWWRNYLVDLIREVIEYYCQVREAGERLILEVNISK